jgi:predicted pyridoxine 5'-phosphate oxidase superfamily flavin-nucleotide-binding protein
MASIEPGTHLSACGSEGELRLQELHDTSGRAQSFYRNQMIDHLNDAMRAFIALQEMLFVATADARGNGDCSFRAGPAGFVRILGERALAYPEYRGNGVMASLGNLTENPHIGLLFVDFARAKIGLHVNGSARVVENDEFAWDPEGAAAAQEALGGPAGRRPERWVRVAVEEAYIHCSKHIPMMRKVTGQHVAWGTDDERAKGGDYFGVRSARQAKRGP